MPEPPAPPDRSGFRRLVVLLAIVAALAAVAVVMRDSLRRPPAPPLTVGEPEDEITRALRLAGVDSTKKNEWVDEVPHVDLAGLPAARVEVFLRFANARRCTCGCGFTLAACRRFDPTCEVSGPLVEALLDSVARGLVANTDGLRERPVAAAR